MAKHKSSYQMDRRGFQASAIARCRELLENFLWGLDFDSDYIRSMESIASGAGVAVAGRYDVLESEIRFVELATGVAVSAASHTLLEKRAYLTPDFLGSMVVDKEMLMIRLPVLGELAVNYDQRSVLEVPNTLTLTRMTKGMRYASHYFRTGHFSSVLIQIRPTALLPFLGLSDEQGELFLHFYPAAPRSLFEVREYPLSEAMIPLVENLFRPEQQGAELLVYLRAQTQLVLTQLLVEQGDATFKGKAGVRWTVSQKRSLYRARDLVLENVADPPGLIALAQQVGLNRNTLNRGFRDLFGTTVAQFAKEAKLQRAWSLLQSTDLAVSEVADLVGYSYVNNLISAFHKRFGISPKQARLHPEQVNLLGRPL